MTQNAERSTLNAITFLFYFFAAFFFATTFFATGFFAATFLVTVFLTAVFLAAVFLAAVFFAAAFFVTGFLVAAFFTVAFFVIAIYSSLVLIYILPVGFRKFKQNLQFLKKQNCFIIILNDNFSFHWSTVTLLLNAITCLICCVKI